MSYHKKYYDFQEELWKEFEKLVRIGAKFPMLIEVWYEYGINPDGLSVDTEGRSHFLATELLANANYTLHEETTGKDIIVESGHVTFVDTEGTKRTLEPDITDLWWCSKLLDAANGIDW